MTTPINTAPSPPKKSPPKKVALQFHIIQDINVIKHLKEGDSEGFLLPAEPEFMLSYEDAFRRIDGSDESITTIFSLQLWIGIRVTLETKVEDAISQMQATARHMKRALERHMPAATGPRKSCGRNMGRCVREITRFMLKDITLLTFRARIVASHLSQVLTQNSYVVDAACYLTADVDHLYRRGLTQDAPLSSTDAMVRIPPSFKEAAPALSPSSPEPRKDYAGGIGIREALYNRYADSQRDCYYFLQYLEELTIHRLRIYHVREFRAGAIRNGLVSNVSTTGILAPGVAPPAARALPDAPCTVSRKIGSQDGKISEL
ncbi:hypothetical protein B0H67DRAFT_650259 [Lasiosphaeris hirsuta]|uniref:Uncharacterized protein n=1 Tax=Lasiosphaeris hirsuta TaxID=260670 RepID=A0AA39ZR77_9PEZI|nr:hypothetical protein B0H67DRAFT_650259 [Lasiosphaeris hirsuta]